ncbi:hypothetical protein B0F90DRAFT_1825054 [Multifurca ochricompacta]|uniref:Uncharacterized protein n=1 Tax=Multifurca ochricompacta TaxID=376703 RepID=A0AAD4LW90_9AGAM|nr:hypothetical protein B0F90DRAFT_1825054 [Multifurca ochricompacta]
MGFVTPTPRMTTSCPALPSQTDAAQTDTSQTDTPPVPIIDITFLDRTIAAANDVATLGALLRPSDAPTLPPSPESTSANSTPPSHFSFTMTDIPVENITQAITLASQDQTIDQEIRSRVMTLLQEVRARLEADDSPAVDLATTYRPTSLEPESGQLPDDAIVQQTQQELEEEQEHAARYNPPPLPFMRNHEHSHHYFDHCISDNAGRINVARWLAYDYRRSDPRIAFTMGAHQPVYYIPLYITPHPCFDRGPNPILTSMQQRLFEADQNFTTIVNGALDDMDDPGAWAEVSRYRYGARHLDEAH